MSTSVQGNNEVVSIGLGQDGDLKEDTDLHNLQKWSDTIGNAHTLSENNNAASFAWSEFSNWGFPLLNGLSFWLCQLVNKKREE